MPKAMLCLSCVDYLRHRKTQWRRRRNVPQINSHLLGRLIASHVTCCSRYDQALYTFWGTTEESWLYVQGNLVSNREACMLAEVTCM